MDLGIGPSRRYRRAARLWAGCLLTLYAALVAALPRNPHFDAIGVPQGLPQESVLAMVQDRQGFLWIGTQGGLSRYDGYRLVTYKSDPSAANSLADDRVNALLCDDQGRLWVGTRGGLLRYDPTSNAFIRYLPPREDLQHPAALDVRALAADGKGGLWIATRYGLQHLDPSSGRFRTWRHDPTRPASLIDDEIWALATDDAGELWVGTEAGLDRLLPGTQEFDHFRIDDPAAPDPRRNAVWALLPESGGVLWVGTFGGLERWQFVDGHPQRQAFTAENGIAPDTITSIVRDSHGRLWAGTFTQGLLRQDPGSNKFISYRHKDGDPYSLASNDVQSIYLTRDGCLWAGTWDEGLSRIDLESSSFERYVHLADSPEGLSDNRVGGISGDAGGLWIATLGGLDHFDRATGRITHFHHDAKDPASLGDDTVYSTFVDSQHRIWAGTAHGLNRYDPATSRFQVHHFIAGGSGDDAIFFIGESRTHRLWIGSHDGLHDYDPVSGQTNSFHHDPANASSIGEGVVRKVLEDRRGNIWVATAGGLDRFNPVSEQFTHFRHDPRDPQSLIDNHVGDLFEDRDGEVWVGTAAGLDHLLFAPDGGIRFHAYTTREGLSNNLIGGILQDDRGLLWISTADGLTRFDPAREQFHNYDADDGLLDGTYLIASAYRDSDGALYFGNFHGLTGFHPEAVIENRIAPTVAITDLQIPGQSLIGTPPPEGVTLDHPLPETTAVRLPYAIGSFSIEFAALHFGDPGRNRFRYQLEGYDSSWTDADASRRFVGYTHLDPGHYVFHVLAANENGVWSDPGASLSITITPPYWMTWWFRALLAACVLLSGTLAYRTRVIHLARRQVTLEKEVASRTAEVVQQKAIVEQQKTVAEQQRAEAERQRAEAERQRAESEARQKQVESAHRNIALLSEIGRELTTKLDRESIVRTLYGHVDKLMTTDVFGIGLYRPERELIDFPMTLARGGRYPPYTRSMREPAQLAVWCVLHRSEILINDIEADAGRYTDDLQRTVAAQKLGPTQEGIDPGSPKSMIYMPLLVENRVLGVVTAQSYQTGAYQPHHVDMLRTLAAYCAVALDNADAYVRLQKMQDRLIQQEKMASLGRLVAGVAHEVNTPLGNIRMSTSIILQHVDALARRLQRGELQRSSLESFLDTVRMSGSLIDGAAARVDELITTFKQLSMDPSSVRLRRFNASETLDLIVESLRPHTRAAGAMIVVDAEPAVMLVGDPVRFEQVVTNLLTNAIRHGVDGRDNGRICITLRSGPAGVDLTVADNGVGIPEDLRSKIFEPFVTSKFGQGHSGLGLYLVHSIVTGIFRGTISVESTEGEGSLFAVHLPNAVAHREELNPDGQAPRARP